MLDSLDQELSDILPGFNVVDPFGQDSGITLRQIASELSGLPREAPCVVPCNFTTKEMLKRLQSTQLVSSQISLT